MWILYLMPLVLALGFVVVYSLVHKSHEKEKAEYFNKKVLPVVNSSTKIKELEGLNKTILFNDINECIKIVEIKVQTVSEFNRKTKNLAERIFQEDPKFFVDAFEMACENDDAITLYDEKTEKIKSTPDTVAKSVEGVSIEEFYKIEKEEFEKRKLHIPTKFYVSVMCKFQNHAPDEIKIGLPFFEPLVIKYLRSFTNEIKEKPVKTPINLMFSGVSVTKRIEQITQPRGGYLNPKSFEVAILSDRNELNQENIHSSLVGIAVDYLTRFMLENDKRKAFDISLLGAKVLKKENDYEKLLEKVTGLDDTSIINACKLAGFDVAYRAGIIGYKPYEEINPDALTIENVRIMVKRSLNFFEQYGPVKKFGFTFEIDGYTNTVSKGDGDFLTETTLWDFKTICKEPTSKHTLQLIMYYIMGKHSRQDCFKNITKIGIFNPRLNKAYVYDMGNLDKSIIRVIERDIICY